MIFAGKELMNYKYDNGKLERKLKLVFKKNKFIISFINFTNEVH